MTPMKLPEDLTAFLKAGRQLRHDPEACEMGAITLRRLEEMRVELFPVDPGRGVNDPHEGETGSYLVPGVDLIASSTGGYDEIGLLLWFPREGRYGFWDEEHGHIHLLPRGTSWVDIANAPVQHLNAAWGDAEAVPAEELVPDPRYRYSPEQLYAPLADSD
jgi:hypothetical protein